MTDIKADPKADVKPDIKNLNPHAHDYYRRRRRSLNVARSRPHPESVYKTGL